jgi:hypothetical protein
MCLYDWKHKTETQNNPDQPGNGAQLLGFSRSTLEPKALESERTAYVATLFITGLGTFQPLVVSSLTLDLNSYSLALDFKENQVSSQTKV